MCRPRRRRTKSTYARPAGLSVTSKYDVHPAVPIFLNRAPHHPGTNARRVMHGGHKVGTLQLHEPRLLGALVVARLAARGYVRVIVTTNSDRLLEKALRDQGVTPVIISTTDMIRGAMPLQFERVTIFKLHGDYLDTRITNTPTELATYDAAINDLLDRIFDEYGLDVAGWSATWDPALRGPPSCVHRTGDSVPTGRSLAHQRAKLAH
jgi:hypothetical protein